MASVSSLGLGSGVLTQDVIDKLKKADQSASLKPIERKKVAIEAKQKDLDALTVVLANLKSAQNPLHDELTFLSREADVSNDGIGVTVEKGVEVQDFNIKVEQLAQAKVYQSASFASKSSKIIDKADSPAVFKFYARIRTELKKRDTTTGLKYKYTSKQVTINIDDKTSWSDLTGKISSATNGSVRATIINTGGSIPYKLVMQSKEPGVDNSIYMGNVVKSAAIKDKYYTGLTGGVVFGPTAGGSQFKINGAAKELFTEDFTFKGFEQTINSKSLEVLQTGAGAAGAATGDIIFKTAPSDVKSNAQDAATLLTNTGSTTSAVSKLRNLSSQLLQQVNRGTKTPAPATGGPTIETTGGKPTPVLDPITGVTKTTYTDKVVKETAVDGTVTTTTTVRTAREVQTANPIPAGAKTEVTTTGGEATSNTDLATGITTTTFTDKIVTETAPDGTITVTTIARDNRETKTTKDPTTGDITDVVITPGKTTSSIDVTPPTLANPIGTVIDSGTSTTSTVITPAATTPTPTKTSFAEEKLLKRVDNILDVTLKEEATRQEEISTIISSIRARFQSLKDVNDISATDYSKLDVSNYKLIEKALNDVVALQTDATTGIADLINDLIGKIPAGATGVVAPPFPDTLPKVIDNAELDAIDIGFKSVSNSSKDILDKLSYISAVLKKEEDNQEVDKGVELKGLEIIAHMINFRSKDTANYPEYKDIKASVSPDGRQLILNDDNGDAIELTGSLLKHFNLDGTDYKAEEVDNKANSQKLMTNFDFESIQDAHNSKFKYNGVSITSNKNKIDDLITGVTIQLQSVNNSASFVKIKANEKLIEDSFNKFVEAYNAVSRKITELTAYNSGTKKSASLQGESDVYKVETSLSNILNKIFEQQGIGPNITSLIALGLEKNKDGTIKLKNNDFKKALAKDINDIQKLFLGWNETTKHTINKGKKDEKEIENITKHDGVFTEINKLLKTIFDGSDTTLGHLGKSYKDRIKRLTDSYTKESEQINNRYESMKKQFAAYDAIMSNLERSFASLKSIIENPKK